jgi:hypothetical protein
MLDPPVLTPFNITVIRFAQDGMPVKSMLVPLVVATEVASVSGCESLAGVTAPFAMFAVGKTPVVSVVVSSNVMPEDVMEVGMVRT